MARRWSGADGTGLFTDAGGALAAAPGEGPCDDTGRALATGAVAAPGTVLAAFLLPVATAGIELPPLGRPTFPRVVPFFGAFAERLLPRFEDPFFAGATQPAFELFALPRFAIADCSPKAGDNKTATLMNIALSLRR